MSGPLTETWVRPRMRNESETCSGRCFFKENGVRCAACGPLRIFKIVK